MEVTPSLSTRAGYQNRKERPSPLHFPPEVSTFQREQWGVVVPSLGVGDVNCVRPKESGTGSDEDPLRCYGRWKLRRTTKMLDRRATIDTPAPRASKRLLFQAQYVSLIDI